MYEIEDASVPAGTVVQVVQAGYLIGDRVLRPALVAVSKGGRRSPRVRGRALPSRWPTTILTWSRSNVDGCRTGAQRSVSALPVRRERRGSG